MPESLLPLRTLKNRKNILVDIYDDGAQTVSLGEGKKPLILLPDDTFGRDFDNASEYSRHPGIRPRWAMVVATTEHAEKAGIKVGDKVLMDTMKWTRGVEYVEGRRVWSIEVEDVLLVDDDGLTEDELDYIASRYDVDSSES